MPIHIYRSAMHHVSQLLRILCLALRANKFQTSRLSLEYDGVVSPEPDSQFHFPKMLSEQVQRAFSRFERAAFFVSNPLATNSLNAKQYSTQHHDGDQAPTAFAHLALLPCLSGCRTKKREWHDVVTRSFGGQTVDNACNRSRLTILQIKHDCPGPQQIYSCRAH